MLLYQLWSQVEYYDSTISHDTGLPHVKLV